MDWQFSEWPDGRVAGWNHGAIANFKKDSLRNLVRETLQNSLDNPESKDSCVRVEFRLHDVDRSEIPGIEGLVGHINECANDAIDQNEDTKKALAFALNVAKRQKIKILEISDYSTTGLVGPADRGKPFHNYLFTEGNSDPNADRAGSHGLGKFAPLVSSAVRTIFVSTQWKEAAKAKTLFQGMSVLMSRSLSENRTSSNFGYFGEEGFKAANRPPEEASWMVRDEVGTSIYLLGWDVPKNWEKKIIGYALASYFAAFARGCLILSVNDYDITKETVAEYFEKEAIFEALYDESRDDAEQFERAKYYLRCIQNGDGIIEEAREISPRPGHGVVYLCVEENAPQKIAFVRNNILITEQIPHFYRTRKRNLYDYVGVYEVKNEEGRQLLRRMENPSHSELSADYLPPDEKQMVKLP